MKYILKEVIDDPFQKQWWNAIEPLDVETLKKLMASPEIGRMSSRSLSSLADGLNLQTGGFVVAGDFLRIVDDRFPGEFWVHFRLAMFGDFSDGAKTDEKQEKEQSLLHLTAAVAARPRSAVARAALGMQMLEIKKDDPKAPRMLESASELEPSSPWPHLFLGLNRLEDNDWTRAKPAFIRAVKAEPDTSFALLFSFVTFLATKQFGNENHQTIPEFDRFIDEVGREGLDPHLGRAQGPAAASHAPVIPGDRKEPVRLAEHGEDPREGRLPQARRVLASGSRGHGAGRRPARGPAGRVTADVYGARTPQGLVYAPWRDRRRCFNLTPGLDKCPDRGDRI